MTSEKIVVGVDIGGTNIRCALARRDDPSGIIMRRSDKTPADAGPEAVVAFIAREVALCLEEAGLEREAVVGVGCAAPGITDAGAGVVISAANLRGWRDVPLARLLEEKAGVAATIENDVKAAALGEFRYGAGKGRRSLVYMTVSTGVSAGIIIDGRVLRGHNHFAGEIAYLLGEPDHIGRDWGANGCLELTSAGVGISREWAAAHGDEAPSVSAAEVFAAARAGDPVAVGIINRAGDYLAQAAVALCAIIDPEVLVVGGGIAENEPALIEHISEVVQETVPFPPPVVRAALGGDAPLIGALALIAERSAINR
jgi:glucokinase